VRCSVSRSPGEKGIGKMGKPLHYKGSAFHRVITQFMRVPRRRSGCLLLYLLLHNTTRVSTTLTRLA
jgi:hypothetical protein